MSKVGIFGELFLEGSPDKNLRLAAKAYLHTSLMLYIKNEGEVSIWEYEKFGDSANIVCSLNRAIEHLLKLRLFKIDPFLLYPLPKKVEEYCHLKQIATKNDKELDKKIKDKEILSRTISFKDAIMRVGLTQSGTNYDFRHFNEIYALRNSLEHHWDRNEEFLKKVVGSMTAAIVPCLKEYIRDVLQENPEEYFPESVLQEVERIDRAIQKGHSLRLQARLEDHQRLFAEDQEACRRKYSLPGEYIGLDEEETQVECPVCHQQFYVLWELEPDYDVEGTTGEGYFCGAFPDFKCLFCNNCHFYVDGADIYAYLPEDYNIDLGSYYEGH